MSKESLTANESLSLWNSYLSETMSLVVTKYFLSLAEDPKVIEMLEQAVAVSEDSFQKLCGVFFE